MAPQAPQRSAASRGTRAAQELQVFMTDTLYWTTVSGSPFHEVAQPWTKNDVYQSEWLYKKAGLDR